MADSNALATVGESYGLAPIDLFNDARLQLIRDLTAKDAPPNLFMAMIEIAKVRGLDPLAKQISLINYAGQWQITTTIDGYRALAERTGCYAGSDPAIFAESGLRFRNDKTIPDTATVTVWKLVQGQRVPFSATVYWEEYYGGEKNFAWNKMPRTMLAKVAESHALRKAFPTVLSGVYTDSEMDQAGAVVGEVINNSTGEIVQRAPQRAQHPRPAQTTQTSSVAPARAQTAAQAAIAALHAKGAKLNIDHDGIHAIAVARYGVASVKELDGKMLFEMNKLMDDPEAAADALYDATHAVIDVELSPEQQAEINDFDSRHPATRNPMFA